jgi:hypothetical protein
VLPNATFRVKLENDHEIIAHTRLCGGKHDRARSLVDPDGHLDQPLPEYVARDIEGKGRHAHPLPRRVGEQPDHARRTQRRVRSVGASQQRAFESCLD